ncbi:hypothetical protein AYI70_g2069 [Smittium culicis]|uniref:Uncharacterized protein n=1 Tax=Smittium culicis TaxID=133412 RepID=A0A1R1YA12_9FUNG|nr:hypothetical protein AYI70_g2069 [Smittium culicis]
MGLFKFISTSNGLISPSANTNPSAASSSFLYISKLKHTISASISHGWILYPCQHSVDSSRTGRWYDPSLFLKYTYGQQYLLYPVNKNVTFCAHPNPTTRPILLVLHLPLPALATVHQAAPTPTLSISSMIHIHTNCHLFQTFYLHLQMPKALASQNIYIHAQIKYN